MSEINLRNEPTNEYALPVVAAEPPPELRYRRAMRIVTAVKQLWRSRAIVWGLMVRQIRSQYSQQVLGLAWVLVAPLAQMFVFSFLLGHANTKNVVNFSGVPRPLFLYVGLVGWSFFAGGVQTGGLSLTANPLLNKVYAPREVFPIAQVGTSLLNAFASALALPLLLLIYGRAPSATAAWIVVPCVILVCFTIAVALIVSAVTVYARDLRSGLPLLLQLGMFAPGVLYPVSQRLDVHWRNAYAAVMPVGALIDQIRQSFFLDRGLDWAIMAICAASAGAWLLLSFMFFKRLETGFADVS